MFNKLKFADLLLKAIGDRTASAYAEITGVNRTYISKLLNEKLDNPPGPDILNKLASAAHGGVTYEELMNAAGYLPKTYTNTVEYPDHKDEIEYDENGNVISVTTYVTDIVEFTKRYEEKMAAIASIWKENNLGDAVVRIVNICKEFKLSKSTMMDMIDKAVEKYGLPGGEGEIAAHGPAYPGSGALGGDDRL